MGDLIFGLIGGDARQAWLARILAAKGYPVRACCPGLMQEPNGPRATGPERALWDAECVVLPLPLLDANGNVTGTDLSFASVLEMTRQGALLCGGLVRQEQIDLAADAGFELIDYYKNEQLQILNAVPTAEGAVARAMERMPVTVYRANMLVTGWGRVAKRLTMLLLSMGAKVTVAARSPQALADARTLGCEVLPCSELPYRSTLPYQAVFNTVPAVLFSEREFRALPAGAVFLDLASGNFADIETARSCGILAERAPGLPGKTSPCTAAEYLCESLFAILKERGLEL